MHNFSQYDNDFREAQLDVDPEGDFVAIIDDIFITEGNYGQFARIKMKIFAQTNVGKVVYKDYFINGDNKEWAKSAIKNFKNDLFKIGLTLPTLSENLERKETVKGTYVDLKISLNNNGKAMKYINRVTSRTDIDSLLSLGYTADCIPRKGGYTGQSSHSPYDNKVQFPVDDDNHPFAPGNMEEEVFEEMTR